MNEQDKQKYKKSNIYYLVLTGIFMAITIVMKLIFHFIPIANGYGIEFHLIGYVYGMMLINNRKWQWTFGLLTPWVILMIPPSVINFWQFLVEYIVALYIFLPFIYFDLIVNGLNKTIKSRKTSMFLQILIFCLMLIITVFEKLALHTIAGKMWWLKSDSWYASFIYNLPIYAITLGVILPLGLVCYPSLIQLRNR